MRWNLVSGETQTVLELPNDFHPTDMHWFPRSHHGGGSIKTNQSKRGGSSSQGNELQRC